MGWESDDGVRSYESNNRRVFLLLIVGYINIFENTKGVAYLQP